MNFLETYWTDVYKTGHKPMLPTGSTLMYSNNTPRSGKYSNCPNDGKIVVFGQQMLVRKLKKDWDDNFFNRPIEEIDQFGEDLTKMLMLATPYDVTHGIFSKGFNELNKYFDGLYCTDSYRDICGIEYDQKSNVKQLKVF